MLVDSLHCGVKICLPEEPITDSSGRLSSCTCKHSQTCPWALTPQLCTSIQSFWQNGDQTSTKTAAEEAQKICLQGLGMEKKQPAHGKQLKHGDLFFFICRHTSEVPTVCVCVCVFLVETPTGQSILLLHIFRQRICQTAGCHGCSLSATNQR